MTSGIYTEFRKAKSREPNPKSTGRNACATRLFTLALAEGFVEEDGGGRGGVEGFDVALHGDLDAGVGGVDDVFGEAGAFVADEEGDGLAPVEFPGGGGRVTC